MEGGFQIVSTTQLPENNPVPSCHASPDASCICSSNYLFDCSADARVDPNEYLNLEGCTFRSPENVPIVVEAFVTESASYDYFTINGVKYGGTNAPVNVEPVGDFTWTSDYSVPSPAGSFACRRRRRRRCLLAVHISTSHAAAVAAAVAPPKAAAVTAAHSKLTPYMLRRRATTQAVERHASPHRECHYQPDLSANVRCTQPDVEHVCLDTTQPVQRRCV